MLDEADGNLTLPFPRVIPITVEPGTTVLAMVQASGLPDELYPYVYVKLNGTIIYDWASVFIIDGDKAEFLVLPSGGNSGNGKQLLASVAMLAITIAAPFAATAILGKAAVGGLMHAGLTAGISLVGSLMIRALIPPASISTAGGSTSSPAKEPVTYSYTGQSNEVRLYQRVPRIYGRVRFVPPLAATPQIINTGKSSRVSVLYDFGLGNIAITDLNSGSLDLEVLDPEIRIYRNKQNPDLDFITRAVAYTTLDYAMVQNEPIMLTTNTECIGATVDILFPVGLVRLTRNGDRRINSAGFRIRYRPTSGGAWQILPATQYSGANKNQEALTYVAEYQVTDLYQENDVYTAWVTKQDLEENHRVSLWYKGRNIYNREHDNFDQLQAITVEGRTFQRGVSRDSVTERDGDSRVGYEMLVGYPATGNTVLINNSTSEPFVVSAKIKFDVPDTYQIEITRTTPVSDTSQYNSIRDESRVNMIKSWKRGAVLNLRKPHTMVEIRYTATDKTSGVIQDFNAICESVLRDFNASGWIDEAITTSNPALICLNLLTGTGSKDPLTAAQIDFPSWYRLRNLCNQWVTTTVNGVTTRTRKYSFNGIFQDDVTMRDAIGAVLTVCRAGLIMTSAGKWGVMIDEENNTPRQLITPINSWGFSASRPFIKVPDGLRVAFTNEDSNWTPAEVMVYRSGKNAETAILIEDMPTMGITSMAQAWRYGRYMLAQAIVRTEQFTVNMDVENLVVQRGDKVLVQHDVPLFGGQAFRVTFVDHTNKLITLDSPIDMPTGYWTARAAHGTISSGTILGQIDDNIIRLNSVDTINVDTLIVLDTGSSAVAEPYLVQAIEPGEDLTARLTLIKYDEDVYTADSGAMPVWDPGFGQDILDKVSVAVDWVSVTWEWVYIDSIPWLRLRVDWKVTGGQATYGGVNYETSRGNEPWVSIATVPDGETLYNHYIRYDDRTYFDGSVRLRLTPYNAMGKRGTSIRRDVRLPAYANIPEPPTKFFADIRSQEITLTWQASPSLDVIDYVIRYSPKTDATATWEKAQFVTRVNKGHLSHSKGARTGTYFIVAENIVGRQSRPVSTRTTIETLPDINVVEDYEPAPTWAGSLINFTRGLADAYSYALVRMLDNTDQQTAVPVGWSNTLTLAAGGSVNILVDVSIDSSSLVSGRIWGPDPESRQQAIYTMSNTIDLGDVYEVRIQSFIEAYAVNAGVFDSASSLTAFRGTDPSHQLHTISAEEIYDVLTLARRARTLVFPYAEEAVSSAAVEFEENWDCWLEYRAIDQLDVIANWVPSLADVPSMSLGTSEWGPWRAIRVGDATGRAFQFRIVGEAERDGIIIIVTQGAFEIDMTDRTWRVSNLSVPPSGLTVNFDPAFGAPPVIAVTIEGSTTAISYKATNLTRTAVTITLYNAAGTAVSGQIDLAALGYGKQRSSGL